MFFMFVLFVQYEVFLESVLFVLCVVCVFCSMIVCWFVYVVMLSCEKDMVVLGCFVVCIVCGL